MIINQLDLFANYIPIESGTLTPTNTSTNVNVYKYAPIFDSIVMIKLTNFNNFDNNYVAFSVGDFFESFPCSDYFLFYVKQKQKIECILNDEMANAVTVSYYCLSKIDIANNIIYSLYIIKKNHLV